LPSDLQEKRFKVLICGGASMIVSILYALRELNFPSDAVFIYGTTGPEYVRAVYGQHALLSSHKSYEVHDNNGDEQRSKNADDIGLCTAQLIDSSGAIGSRDDNKKKRKIIINRKQVCTGLRLVNWPTKPDLIRDKNGSITIFPPSR
jgi:hypothetical protein